MSEQNDKLAEPQQPGIAALLITIAVICFVLAAIFIGIAMFDDHLSDRGTAWAGGVGLCMSGIIFFAIAKAIEYLAAISTHAARLSERQNETNKALQWIVSNLPQK